MTPARLAWRLHARSFEKGQGNLMAGLGSSWSLDRSPQHGAHHHPSPAQVRDSSQNHLCQEVKTLAMHAQASARMRHMWANSMLCRSSPADQLPAGQPPWGRWQQAAARYGCSGSRGRAARRAYSRGCGA